MLKIVYAFKGNFFLAILKIESEKITIITLKSFNSFQEIKPFITDKCWLCIDKENVRKIKLPKVKFINILLKPTYYNLSKQYYYQNFIFDDFEFNNLQLKNRLRTLTVHQEYSMMREFITVLYKLARLKQNLIVNNQVIFG